MEGMKRFLVTGVGRSGTMYIARALRAIGLRCGHEDVYSGLGMNAWSDWAGDSSWMAVMHIALGVPRPDHVVHVTRHPSRNIASWYRVGFGSDNVVLKQWKPELWHTRESLENMSPDERFEWCCDIYCALIDGAQDISDSTWHVEDLQEWEHATRFMKDIGHSACSHSNENLSPFWTLGTQIHHDEMNPQWSVPGGMFPWRMLPSSVTIRAAALGYEEESTRTMNMIARRIGRQNDITT